MNKWMEEQYEALGISREVYEFGEKIEVSLKIGRASCRERVSHRV